MTRARKNFKTKELADAFYEAKREKVTLACEPSDKCFTYVNDWGNKIMVQKMY
jgi:hypothetical protein